MFDAKKNLEAELRQRIQRIHITPSSQRKKGNIIYGTTVQLSTTTEPYLYCLRTKLLLTLCSLLYNWEVDRDVVT